MDKKDFNALKLKNQICFPLYACSRKVINSYTPHLKALGLTYTQYIVMLVLWEKETVTIRELSETLHLDTGTISPLIGRLEAGGLIKKERKFRDEDELENDRLDG